MKILRTLFFLVFSMTVLSCGSDDDICTSGEGTPRIKLKFKDGNNKLVQLAQIYVDVDYGDGTKNVINQMKADSVLIPLKVDGSGSTELIIHTSESGAKSRIKVNYNEESVYVSPACGIRKLYHNVSSELKTSTPVKALEQTQTEIINENKTHLYLIF